MSLLELGGKKFTIPVGEVALGSDASCVICLTGAGIEPRHAVLQGQADGQVIIPKAAPAGDVVINGVRLGAEPTPLLHREKGDVGGHELTFVDDRRSGSTQYVQALNRPPGLEGPGKGGAAAKPAAVGTTGGRVVSLTDGREYVIAGTSLVFGREAGSDVVVAGKDVSRRHAEIVQTPRGYLLVDSSTNGTFVNEERIQGQRILARADVVRIGEENFRFYADLARPPAPAAPASAGPPPGPAASAPQAAPQPAPGARSSRPAGPSQAGPLASFLAKGGALKGQRFQIKTPVANIGRADYNDVVLPDPSVSTTHAKLQRREGVWVVVDLDSTNGTFVDGERVTGESPLAPGALLRFGDMQVVFEPSDDALGMVRGGGTQVMKDFSAVAPPPRPGPPLPPAAAPSRAAPPASPPRPRPPAKGRPGSKRPAAQQLPAQRRKGRRKGAAGFLLAAAGLTALLYRLLLA